MHDPLFFFGSLRDPDLFARVAGHPVEAYRTEVGAILDHRAERAVNEAYPVLVAAPGARAEGVLVHGLPPAIVERIAFYETTDYVLGPAMVETEAGPVGARLFHATEILPSSGEWWSLETWRRDGKPLALHAADLVMAYFGRITLEAAAAVWPDIYREARLRLEAEARLIA